MANKVRPVHPSPAPSAPPAPSRPGPFSLTLI